MHFKTNYSWPVFLLASLLVLSHWGFTQDSYAALGLNYFLGGLGFVGLLKLERARHFHTSSGQVNWVWEAPIYLILISFLIYENIWLKSVSVVIAPLLIATVFASRSLDPNGESAWSRHHLKHLFLRTFLPLKLTQPATKELFLLASTEQVSSKVSLTKPFLRGLLILIPLGTISLVLLTSADQNFGQVVNDLWGQTVALFDSTIVAKLVTILILSVFIESCLMSWSKPQPKPRPEDVQATINNVTAATVLAGLLFIYVLFLGLQLENLMVGRLPLDLTTTQSIVKSGFWQLFTLSIINTVIFLTVFSEPSKTIRALISVFIAASTLLVLSACWRLGLYVYFYGLSHEKYFASYTALYSLIFFCYFIYISVSAARHNILKHMFLSAAWLYALATITPVEKVIFKTNLALSQRSDTRIDLYHLSLMSLDVSNDVNQAIENGKLPKGQWHWWNLHTRDTSCDRAWYQQNLSRILNCGSLR